jgi:hypothetical protein
VLAVAILAYDGVDLGAGELVLQARDLLIRASISTSSRSEQSNLLDLLEIFRDI